MIDYKAINNFTDMVVAAKGALNINYNRIISSSTNPYSVNITNNNVFGDPINSPS